MRVLVVGLNPSRKGGSSSSLKRLYEWMNYLNLEIVSFTNLYEDYEIRKDKSQIDTVRTISKEYDKIIALGQVVSIALSNVDIDCCSLPHPSGLNRKMNDKEYVHKQLEACKNYLYGR